jgi:dTDP-4-dehydrorhamnose reductase
MKVLLTGKNGQLATELAGLTPNHVKLICLSSSELDISDQISVDTTLSYHNPDLVINAAAYTAVDKAESDQQTAFNVNALGSEYLAKACKKINAKMIHISTDFVFDGAKTTPYQAIDQTNPINVYGASKLAGETKVNDILGEQATIIRTAWVYSKHGHNFVKTMLRFMAEKEQLGIVYDQVGTPTWAKGLAEMIWALVSSSEANSHLVSQKEATVLHWTDAGVCSWYDFAIAIQELALEKKMLKKAIPIRPIPASDYPTPAKRPSFSVIDKSIAEKVSGLQTLHWRKQLSSMMDDLNKS